MTEGILGLRLMKYTKGKLNVSIRFGFYKQTHVPGGGYMDWKGPVLKRNSSLPVEQGRTRRRGCCCIFCWLWGIQHNSSHLLQADLQPDSVSWLEEQMSACLSKHGGVEIIITAVKHSWLQWRSTLPSSMAPFSRYGVRNRGAPGSAPFRPLTRGDFRQKNDEQLREVTESRLAHSKRKPKVSSDSLPTNATFVSDYRPVCLWMLTPNTAARSDFQTAPPSIRLWAQKL